MRISPKLIIGLGNPDKKHQNTYHNVGHLFVDWLKKKQTAGSYIILASDVYMNQSGNFVLKELKKHNAEPDELLIVHDDSDITIGNFKLSYGKGSAGHKGIENIIQVLKTKDFWRLRIGIRPQAEARRQKAETFVLKKISSSNKKKIEEVFKKALDQL